MKVCTEDKETSCHGTKHWVTAQTEWSQQKKEVTWD